MRTSVLHFVRLVFLLLPETRAFGLKATLLRFAGARLGNNVRVCSSALVVGSGDLDIGDDTWVGHQALISVTSRITIGRGVDIGPRVYVGTGTHQIDPEGTSSAGSGISMDVEIADGAWLGANSIILPGVSIGEKSIVAAGAVVAESVAPHVLAAGVPAKVIRGL